MRAHFLLKFFLFLLVHNSESRIIVSERTLMWSSAEWINSKSHITSIGTKTDFLSKTVPRLTYGADGESLKHIKEPGDDILGLTLTFTLQERQSCVYNMSMKKNS